MAGVEESLVARRPRRSTAGNRMELALMELEGMKDMEEDDDFTMGKDEEDVFESDFESTDEEAAQDEVDAAAEKIIREEQSRHHRSARTKLDKVTAAAHARNKASFNPQIYASTSKKPETKITRRVSLGTAINAETGEAMSVDKRSRHSQRSYTMLSTSATFSRIKDAASRKSSAPRKTKVKERPPTQAELIARALDMEEGNISEHRNYLTLEEEKRRRARVVRTAVQGPLLRYISKKEEVRIIVQPVAAPVSSLMPSTMSTSAPLPYGYSYSPPVLQQGNSSMQPQARHLPGQYNPYPFAQAQHSVGPNTFRPPPTGTPQSHSTFLYHNYPLPPPPQPQQPEERIETISRSYVIHEISQSEDASKPRWSETMSAMFGDHVNWEDVRVYVGKGRPFVRPIPTCPVSGAKARYLDPRTGVPFADVHAFEILTKILNHEYVWSESLGCYISQDGAIFS